jgi:hypothetical protein
MIGISYDPPEVLRQFASAKGISFPLLSDVGSRVITDLGLLDRDLAAHHAEFGLQARESQFGVAYPAVFVVDESGRVVEKWIGENYRARVGPQKLLDESLGLALAPAGPHHAQVGSHVTVTATTDSLTDVRWQETRLHVLIDIEAGWHIYGRPIPDGYVPLTVDIDSVPEFELCPAEYPPAQPFRIESLDDAFQVYDGHLEVLVPFAIKVAAGYGSVGLQVKVGYQTCNRAECLPPDRLTIELSLDESAPA